MAPKGKIPDRWIPYKPCGEVIEGTRIICFKVPVDKRVQQNVREIKQIWDVPAVLEIPKLAAVIDLTNTGRYYDPRKFEQANVRHIKIMMPGRVIPPEKKVKKFMDAVDEFLGRDCDSLVGVHCTHGLNRTGYMVCRYMIDRLKMSAEEAIAKFERARGYEIERENYRANLLDSIKTRRNIKVEQKQKQSRDINMDLYENPFLESADVYENDNDDDSISEKEEEEESNVTETPIKKQKLTNTKKRNRRNRRKLKEKKKASQKGIGSGDVKAKRSNNKEKRKRDHQSDSKEDSELTVSEPKKKKNM